MDVEVVGMSYFPSWAMLMFDFSRRKWPYRRSQSGKT